MSTRADNERSPGRPAAAAGYGGPAAAAAGAGPGERIIARVRAIPVGFVRTYGDLWPGAPRLAGRVLATAEIPGLPWWRVVRSDGSLAVGEEQRRRLEAEDVPFRPGRGTRVDLRLARLPHGFE